MSGSRTSPEPRPWSGSSGRGRLVGRRGPGARRDRRDHPGRRCRHPGVLLRGDFTQRPHGSQVRRAHGHDHRGPRHVHRRAAEQRGRRRRDHVRRRHARFHLRSSEPDAVHGHESAGSSTGQRRRFYGEQDLPGFREPEPGRGQLQQRDPPGHDDPHRGGQLPAQLALLQRRPDSHGRQCRGRASPATRRARRTTSGCTRPSRATRWGSPSGIAGSSAPASASRARTPTRSRSRTTTSASRA